MSFKLRAWRALSRILISGAHLSRHVWQVHSLDILLHVFLDFVLVQILETTMVYHLGGSAAIALISDFAHSSFSTATNLLKIITLTRHLHCVKLLLVVAVDVKDIDD